MKLRVLGWLFVAALFGVGYLFPASAGADPIAPNLRAKSGVPSKPEQSSSRSAKQDLQSPAAAVSQAPVEQSNNGAGSIKDLADQVQALRMEVQQLKKDKPATKGSLRLP